MKRISAICACPPHFNPGMHLADLALDFTLRRLGGAQPRRHALYLPSDLRALGSGDAKGPPHFGLPFEYARLQGRLDEALAADAVVYWGDFLHSRHYRRAVARLLVRTGLADAEEAALGIFDGHMLLRQAPAETFRRVLSFGECLLMRGGPGGEDPDYEASARRFFRNVRGAWMRDALSAARVGEIRGDGEGHLGVDPSLLLRPGDLAELCGTVAAQDAFSGGAGVFLGRTKIRPELAVGLASRLAAAQGVRAAWLPWFAEGALEAGTVRSLAPDLWDGREAQSLPQLLANLRACRFVVTDAYHLCLTAWNLGVPSVCLSRAAERFDTAVSDKKKELFCATFGAEDLLVFAEQLEEAARPADPVEGMSRALSEGTLARAVQRRIAGERDRAERALHDRLKEIFHD